MKRLKVELELTGVPENQSNILSIQEDEVTILKYSMFEFSFSTPSFHLTLTRNYTTRIAGTNNKCDLTVKLKGD